MKRHGLLTIGKTNKGITERMSSVTVVNRLYIKEIVCVRKALKSSISLSDIPLCAVISEFLCVCV